MNTDIITVLIADDHPIVRAGLRGMIDRADDIRVVGEAGDGFEALEAIERQAPAVSVLDIEMPRMTGLEVLREIGARSLPTVPIVLTLFDDRDLFNRAIALGAMGYILKDSAPQDVVRGIRRVAAGDPFLGALGDGREKRKVNPRSGRLLALETLTATEKRVLRMIGDDNSTREIAAELGISPRTVESHRASMCSKLGLSGSFALIRFAVEYNMHL